MKKQFCPKGHDTAIVGRNKQGLCRGCARLNAKIRYAARRELRAAYHRLYYAANREQYRKRQRKNRRGLTEDAFLTLLAAQDGRCANPGCETILVEGKALHLDHDHACCPGAKSCGKCIRGLLCNRCNLGVGLFYNDPDRLRGMAQYLENYAAKTQRLLRVPLT